MSPRSRRQAVAGLLITVGLYFTCMTFVSLVLGLYGFVHHWTVGETNDWLVHSVSAQFFDSVLVYGLLLGGIILALRFFHWQWGTIGIKAPQWWHILLGIGAVVPYYFLLIAAVVILKAYFFPSLNLSQKQDIGFNDVQGTMQLVLTFISVAVIPPVVEEITMRGFLYSSLKRWLPAIMAALTVSVLFGLAHLPEGGNSGLLWIGGIDTFILSLVLIGLREWTGNLWAGITLHALKNTIAFAEIYLLVKR